MSTTLRQAAFHRYPILVISGGSSGIGRGLLEAYFNARVDGLAINLSRSCPDELLQEPRLTHLPCDLSDASGRATTFEQLVQLIHERSPEGELLLVNNSGMGDFGSFPKLARERLLQTIDLNVSGTIDLSMRLLPLLRERGGTLMTIASTSAFQPTPMMATYGATKAFLVHWSLALNEELRGSKVSALAVCPGPTYTDFLS
ncbi:MAG: SDR family NAD(P)-dependent oxidoreductase, partial [Coraliomargarita sp.]